MKSNATSNPGAIPAWKKKSRGRSARSWPFGNPRTSASPERDRQQRVDSAISSNRGDRLLTHLKRSASRLPSTITDSRGRPAKVRCHLTLSARSDRGSNILGEAQFGQTEQRRKRWRSGRAGLIRRCRRRRTRRMLRPWARPGARQRATTRVGPAAGTRPVA
jgi:hypothetical protein